MRNAIALIKVQNGREFRIFTDDVQLESIPDISQFWFYDTEGMFVYSGNEINFIEKCILNNIPVYFSDEYLTSRFIEEKRHG